MFKVSQMSVLFFSDLLSVFQWGFGILTIHISESSKERWVRINISCILQIVHQGWSQLAWTKWCHHAWRGEIWVDVLLLTSTTILKPDLSKRRSYDISNVLFPLVCAQRSIMRNFLTILNQMVCNLFKITSRNFLVLTNTRNLNVILMRGQLKVVAFYLFCMGVVSLWRPP